MDKEHLLQDSDARTRSRGGGVFFLTGSANKRFGQLVEGTSGKPLSAIYARSMDSLITKSLRASIRSHHPKMAQTGIKGGGAVRGS